LKGHKIQPSYLSGLKLCRPSVLEAELKIAAMPHFQ